MFSQSLLPALCRAVAAPPDSSASSQAPITWGLIPVSAASCEANCCCPLVKSPLVVDMSVCVCVGACACASSSAKLVVEAGALRLLVLCGAAGSVKALLSEAICA